MGKRKFIALLYESTKQKCANGIFTGTLEENHILCNHVYLVGPVWYQSVHSRLGHNMKFLGSTLT